MSGTQAWSSAAQVLYVLYHFTEAVNLILDSNNDSPFFVKKNTNNCDLHFIEREH